MSDRVNIDSLRVTAEYLRRIEAPFKEHGDPRGLGLGAMALTVEHAIEEIEQLRALFKTAAAAFDDGDEDECIVACREIAKSTRVSA